MNKLIGILALVLIITGPAYAWELGDYATEQGTTATIVWEAPTTRTDGTILTLEQIDGYQIIYGDIAGDPEIIDIAGAGTLTHITPALAPGLYAFALRTVDTDGTPAEWGNPVTKQVMAGPSAPLNLQIHLSLSVTVTTP